jgi:hypothetical protein
MPSIQQRIPLFVGAVTLVAGAALVVAPGAAAGPFGLKDLRAVRLIGLSDLVLVPGLLAGKAPYMVGRAALNLAQAAYLLGAAPKNSMARAGAGTLLALTVADGATGLALSRRSPER